MNESDFKKWVRKNWPWWVESYEPRRGTGIGIPDLQIVVGGRLVPVELKMGEFHNGKLITREVRPAQIAWHREINSYGIRTVLLVGAYDFGKEEWRAYPIDARRINDWRNGFEVGEPLVENNFASLFDLWCQQLLTT